MKFSRFLAAVTRGFGALTLAAIPIIADVASAQDTTTVSSIFRPFPDDSGQIQSARALLSLNRQNKFFDPALGNNDQACVTCHQPDQGFTLNVESIQDAFTSSNGLDPLFRLNDTADRPDADPPFSQETFRLFLDMGIIRIGKTLPTGADFTVEPQDTPRFGPLPRPASAREDDPVPVPSARGQHERPLRQRGAVGRAGERHQHARPGEERRQGTPARG